MNYTLTELPLVASKILEDNSCKIFRFYGEMGVGKTTLIKSLCKELGVKDVITSPTFSLVNEYQSPNGEIFHFDFYRIENEAEAYDIGFEDYLSSGKYVFIEWPEKVGNLIPEEGCSVEITKKNSKNRTIKVTPVN